MLFDKLPSREMILDELEYRATHRIESFYPETGPLRRELYPRHMEFFAAGARHNERLFLGRNRVGKSEAVGAFECVRPAQIAPFSHRRRNSLSPARDASARSSALCHPHVSTPSALHIPHSAA